MSVPISAGNAAGSVRCEYLHQNKGFLNDENEDTVHFHLRCKLWHISLWTGQNKSQADRSDIRIDIEQFCLRMCQAAKSYYDQVHKEKKFQPLQYAGSRFYPDPSEGTNGWPAYYHAWNKAYANGLKAVLEAFPGHILCFSTWEEKRKKLGNRKPSIWILSEKLAERQIQPGIARMHPGWFFWPEKNGCRRRRPAWRFLLCHWSRRLYAER